MTKPVLLDPKLELMHGHAGFRYVVRYWVGTRFSSHRSSAEPFLLDELTRNNPTTWGFIGRQTNNTLRDIAWTIDQKEGNDTLWYPWW